MLKVVTCCLLLIGSYACKHQNDTSDVLASTLPDSITNPAKANEAYVALTKDRLVYNWTFSDTVLSDREGYLNGLTANVDKNKGYKSSRDLPSGLGMGQGLYAAGDPIVSRDYGFRLVVLRLKDPSVIYALNLYADEKDSEVRQIPLINSDAPVIMYNWHDSFLSSFAVVVRNSSAVEIADVLDFSKTGTLFSKIDTSKAISATDTTLSILKRFGSLAPFIGDLSGQKELNDGLIRNAIAAELFASAISLQDGFVMSGVSGANCQSQSNPSTMCLRSLAKLFSGNELIGYGEFSYGESLAQASQILIKIGYLSSNSSNSREQLVEAAVQKWKSKPANIAGAKFLLEQWPQILKIMSKDAIDDAPLATEFLSPVLDKYYARFKAKMTVVVASYLHDDAGTIIDRPYPGLFVTRELTNRNIGQMRVSYVSESSGKKIQGWLPASALGYGNLELKGAD